MYRHIQFVVSSSIKETIPRLMEIWESAVLATHNFLTKEEIDYYKNIVPTYLESMSVYIYVDDSTQEIQGFLGSSEDNIEALFVHNDKRKQGVGKELLLYAIQELKLKKVDVNEENVQAFEFYEHFGFKIVNRTEIDSEGKNHPILQLELKK